jgi:hypothetical protein
VAGITRRLSTEYGVPMSMRMKQSRIVIGALLLVAAVVVSAVALGEGWITNVSEYATLVISGIVVAMIVGGGAFLYKAFIFQEDESKPQYGRTKGELTERTETRDAKRTTLELRPLPDYQGYQVGPSPAVVKVNPDGTKTATLTNDSYATTPEFAFLAPSQHLEAGYATAGETLKNVVAKFGVIRIRAVGGPALKCRAEVRYRHFPQGGRAVGNPWIDEGHLNWFSVAHKRETQRHVQEVYEHLGQGINAYLHNATEDIYEGEEKDLLVTYMFLGNPSVFLCTDADIGLIGYSIRGNPLIFEAEVALAAENLPRSSHHFVVTTRWDYCKIQELPAT